MREDLERVCVHSISVEGYCATRGLSGVAASSYPKPFGRPPWERFCDFYAYLVTMCHAKAGYFFFFIPGYAGVRSVDMC